MRILAFTTDASLEVSLSSLDERFEIVAARDPEGALAEACRSDLALIALGSTERGATAVATLQRLLVGIPCLIVGDVLPEDNPIAPVLTRPFSLDDLTDAMVRAVEESRMTQLAAPADAPADIQFEAADTFPATTADLVADEPADVVPDADPVLAAPEVQHEPPVAAPEVPRDMAAASGHAEPFSIVPPEIEPIFPDHEAVEDLLRQLEAAAAVVSVAPAPPPADPVAWALAALHEIGDADSRSSRPLPATSLSQSEATAARIVRSAAAAPAAGDWLADRTAGRGGLHRLRRRRRSISVAGSPRAAIMRRVRSALEGARELESLLDEIPALCDPGTMARALVRETVELLGCETAALYGADTDVFRIAASHGLSPVEQSITVPNDQALFCDIANRLEAVLVAPVDLVRGLVSGIAGSTTEALMLAPLEVDGRCAGILLAGRSRFGDEDLERLWHLAEEAAPGFAASRLIDRIRRRDLPVAL